MLLLLLACALSSDEAPADACTLAPDGTDACPVDACAACDSVEDGIACCIDAHGNGPAGEVTMPDTIYCATSETYDRADYLSEDAARCIAQVHGLGPGLGACFADLVVCDGGARAQWYVSSKRDEGCGWADYEGLVLDARSGRLSSSFDAHGDSVCDE